MTRHISSQWLAALVFAAACSSSPKPVPVDPAPAVRPPLPAATVAEQKSVSFAGMNSRPILQAAMTYPPPLVDDDGPPMSLTASDGTGLRLVTLDARAVVDGPLAFTELRLRFENPQDRVIEGRFAITLPPGAAISRLAMRIDGGWQEAEVVERQLARRAYEDFLHRRQDPALLEKEAGNQFSARIFPIPARGTKDLVLSYSQELAANDAVYSLPLRGLPAIDRLHIEALVGKAAGGRVDHQRMTFDQQAYTPDHDFEVGVDSGLAGLRSEELALVRVAPELDATIAPMSSLAILFDTSASRAPGFATEVARLGELIDQLGQQYGPELVLTVATFDQLVTPIFSGRLGDFGRAQLDAVLARQPLGGSDLHRALTWLHEAGVARRALIVTDGIATVGAVEGDQLRAAVARLKGTVDRLDVALVGGIRDQSLAAELCRGNLSADGVVLDGAAPVAELARRIGQTTRSGIRVAVPGAEWVWPEQLDGVQPGDQYLVYAAIAGGRAPARLPVRLSGAIDQELSVALTPVTRPLLVRAAATARIARLTHQRDGLDPADEQMRQSLEDQIVDLSVKHRVLSDFTALLVLETEADYDRFHIDRRSLADIMTVGPKGIELHSRAKAVVIARDPEPREDTKTKYKPEKKATSQMLDDDDSGIADQAPAGFKEAEADSDADGVVDVADVAEALGGAAMERRLEARPTPPPVASPRGATGSTGGANHDARGAIARRPSPDQPEEPGPASREQTVARPPTAEELREKGPPALTGKLAAIAAALDAGHTEKAVVDALAWRREAPGDVMALIGLGEALEARGNRALAARAYGSIIDLFPSRADLRRFAGQRLQRLGEWGAGLAVDSFTKAVAQRPDHLTGHRLLAYALLRAGEVDAAFAAIEAGLAQKYPDGRFAGGERILAEDLGILGAVWLAREPARRAEIEKRLAAAGAKLATERSLRFVLNWETDANDVDFHIYDAKGGHAFYSSKQLPSGGELYADVTTGYGPECFTIPGTAAAYPYTLQIHYYSRGPMGYGMGQLEILEHDGAGHVRFDLRPFVVMNDDAYVDLGQVTGSLSGQTIAQ